MRILVVEDETLLRRHLAEFVAECFPSSSVSEAKTLAELRALERESATFDLALVDLALPDGNALEWIEAVALRPRAPKIVVLSSESHEFVIHKALHSSIGGFVHKTDEHEVLAAALRAVLAGGVYFSPTVNALRQRMQSSSTFFQKILSPREQELLRLLGQGYSDAEIAGQLSLKTSSVGQHRKNIMSKLDLHTRDQLVAYAKEKGFDRVSLH